MNCSLSTDLHLDYQETVDSLNSNTASNGTFTSNRAALTLTPSVPKNRHNNKLSLKAIFSTIKS